METIVAPRKGGPRHPTDVERTKNGNIGLAQRAVKHRGNPTPGAESPVSPSQRAKEESESHAVKQTDSGLLSCRPSVLHHVTGGWRGVTWGAWGSCQASRTVMPDW